MVYGDAMFCNRISDPQLLAIWTSAVARLGDATGGCLFMCDSGDCFVGNDGLPVELLQFGVY